MKILVTGLCLSRNLGGPAMGLTLIEEVKKRFPNAKFTFAVEPHEFEEEKKWAQYYNINIVRRDRLTSYITTKLRLRELKNIFRLKFGLHKHTILFKEVAKEFLNAIKNADLIIDMSGIAYVGDGVRGPLEGLRQFSNYYFARKYKKPFVRFIQSFGPFNDKKVRYFAKKELNNLEFIPARGIHSAELCRQIIKNKSKVYDFPDSAILLKPATDDWAINFLNKLNLHPKDYIVISPSAIINNIPKRVGGSVGKNHVESMLLVTKELLKKKHKVLLLPHMYSPTKKDCDREICKIIYSRIDSSKYSTSLGIVEEDLDPMQAKALIKNANFAIVSRYHALVAAISSCVPVITLGWNIKYKDLLDYYKMGEMAIDVRKYNPEEILKTISSKLEKLLLIDNYEELMKTRNEENQNKVRKAFDLLYNWININYVN